MKILKYHAAFLLVTFFICQQAYCQTNNFKDIKDYIQHTPAIDVKKEVAQKLFIIDSIPKDKIDDFMKFSKFSKKGGTVTFTNNKSKNADNTFKVSLDLQNLVTDIKAGDSGTLFLGTSIAEAENQKIIIAVMPEPKPKPEQFLNAIIDLSAISCNCTNNSYDADIIDALSFCPDCDDKDVYVYDARCKTLYKRKNNKKPATYKRISNLKQLEFKYNQEFKVKIIHVNRYLKDIEIVAEDSSYESVASALFLNTFGGTNDLLTKLTTAYNNASVQFGPEKNDSNIIMNSVQKFREMVTDFIKEITTLREIREHVYYQCCEPTKDCDNMKDLSLSQISKELGDIKRKHSDLSIELKNANLKNMELKKQKDSLELKKDTLIKANLDTGKIEAAITKVTDQLKAIPGDIETLKEQVDSFWSLFQIPDTAEIKNLVTFNKNFLKKNYTFSTPPIYPQGNREKVSIKIDSRDTATPFKDGLQPSDHQFLKFEGLVRNKWFVSFSSGPFVGIGEKLYSKNYEFKKLLSPGGFINDSSKFMLVESGKTPTPVGLCALANIEKKVTNYWGYGISVGTGLTAEKTPRINYLLGGSLFFGDQHQFGLTAGAVATQANVLKKNLYPDFQVYNSNTETLKYTKDFRVGGFVSFTYTFFTMKSTSNSSNKTK